MLAPLIASTLLAARLIRAQILSSDYEFLGIQSPPVSSKISDICKKLSKTQISFDLEFVLEKSFDELGINKDQISDSLLTLKSYDGEPLEDLKIEFSQVHLGIGASLHSDEGATGTYRALPPDDERGAAESSSSSESEKLINKMKEEVARHKGLGLYVHTLAHLFHADLQVVRLERKYQSCSALTGPLDDERGSAQCWREAKALATETRNMMNRLILPNSNQAHKIENLADIPLYYKSINLAQPSFCSRDQPDSRTLHIFAKSQDRSIFLHSLGEIYNHIPQKNLSKKLYDYFNPGLVWLMTFWNCANSLEHPAENKYMMLLKKFSKARLPALAERFENIFAHQIQAADQVFDRRASAYNTDAYEMLKLLVKKSPAAADPSSALDGGEGEGESSLAEFVFQHKREILEDEALAFLWLATDGSYHRTELMNKYMVLAGFYQCLIMDAAQANLFEIDSIIANGAMWCTPDPANLIFTKTGDLDRVTQTIPLSISGAHELLRKAKSLNQS